MVQLTVEQRQWDSQWMSRIKCLKQGRQSGTGVETDWQLLTQPIRSNEPFPWTGSYGWTKALSQIWDETDDRTRWNKLLSWTERGCLHSPPSLFQLQIGLPTFYPRKTGREGGGRQEKNAIVTAYMKLCIGSPEPYILTYVLHGYFLLLLTASNNYLSFLQYINNSGGTRLKQII